MRQKYRDSVLSTTKQDIMRVANEYMRIPLEKGRTSKVVFGVESIDKKLLREGGWMVEKPIDIIANK